MGCIDLEIAAAAVSLSFALSRFSHHRPFLFYVATDGVTTQQLFLRKKEAVVVTRERDTWSSECSLKESALSDNRGSESYSFRERELHRGGPARRQPTPFQLTFEDSWRENGRPGDGSFVSHRRRRRRLRFNRGGSHLI